MGKEEVQRKLDATNTHLNQIELKVSKLLSEGTTPKDALATVKTQEEALRVKKAQLNEALGAFVTSVTRYDLSRFDLGDDGLGFVEQEIDSPVGLSAGSDLGSAPNDISSFVTNDTGSFNDAISSIMDIGDSKPTGTYETDRQNFQLTDNDDSAHQSGSPIAHKGDGEKSSTVSSASATSHDQEGESPSSPPATFSEVRCLSAFFDGSFHSIIPNPWRRTRTGHWTTDADFEEYVRLTEKWDRAATIIQAHVRGRLLHRTRNLLVKAGLAKATLMQREATRM